MKDQELVISYKQAKRLKKLGVSQDATFYYSGDYLTTTPQNKNHDATAAAFTASEISNYFPSEIWITVRDSNLRRKEAVIHQVKTKGEYRVSLMVDDGNDSLFEIQRSTSKNEAIANGDMLIYLLENGMIDTP